MQHFISLHCMGAKEKQAVEGIENQASFTIRSCHDDHYLMI
jgi:hypothetical protein